jgi:DNA-binding GntR family transcriptional regulator
VNRSADRQIAGISIKPVSIAGQVANVLREKILIGELRPGMPLHEISLAESAGVSRNTLREAVQMLVREGLVRHNVHRGRFVAHLTDLDIDDIYRVRRALEVSGVYASLKVDYGEVAALEECVDGIRRGIDARDWLQSVASDILFHRQLVAFLGSERLNYFFDGLLSELRLALVFIDRASFSGQHLAAQHSELVQLLRARRVSECVVLLTQHLAESERHTRRVIEFQSKNLLGSDASVSIAVQ